MSTHEGGCLCGAIRYSVKTPPARVTFCHCRFCQRATGSDYLVEPIFEKPALEVIAGKPKTYSHRSEGSGKIVDIHFCAVCGTKLFLTFERFPEVVGLYGGTFDDPNWFEIFRRQCQTHFLKRRTTRHDRSRRHRLFRRACDNQRREADRAQDLQRTAYCLIAISRLLYSFIDRVGSVSASGSELGKVSCNPSSSSRSTRALRLLFGTAFFFVDRLRLRIRFAALRFCLPGFPLLGHESAPYFRVRRILT